MSKAPQSWAWFLWVGGLESTQTLNLSAETLREVVPPGGFDPGGTRLEELPSTAWVVAFCLASSTLTPRASAELRRLWG